jgi:hypothetical protein
MYTHDSSKSQSVSDCSVWWRKPWWCKGPPSSQLLRPWDLVTQRPRGPKRKCHRQVSRTAAEHKNQDNPNVFRFFQTGDVSPDGAKFPRQRNYRGPGPGARAVGTRGQGPRGSETQGAKHPTRTCHRQVSRTARKSRKSKLVSFRSVWWCKPWWCKGPPSAQFSGPRAQGPETQGPRDPGAQGLSHPERTRHKQVSRTAAWQTNQEHLKVFQLFGLVAFNPGDWWCKGPPSAQVSRSKVPGPTQ